MATNVPVNILYHARETKPDHAPVSRDGQNQITWRCTDNRDVGFTIEIQKVSSCTDCPPTPFAESSFTAGPGQEVNSGPVKEKSAVGHLYKANIKFTDGKEIDPHIIVDK